MKRGAERQIQREDGEDPHAADGGTGSESQSGSEAEGRIIANRPIRGLPKKKATENPAPSFAQTPSPTPFTFAGFGTSQANTTNKTSAAPSNNLFSGFGAAPASSNSTSSLSAAATPFSFSAPTTNGKPKTDADSSDVEYYCTLRGLNFSLKSQLVEALAKQIEKDPFADLSQVLKAVQAKYEGFRQKAEEKREGGSSTTTAPLSTTTSTSAFSFTAPAAAATAPSAPVKAANPTMSAVSTPSFSLPKPPANGGFSFAGSSFSSKPASQASTTPSLLPGQPTFAVPSTGFYSAFGKNDADEEEDEDEDQDEDQEEEEEETAAKIVPAPDSAPTANPFSSSAVPTPFSTTATASPFGTSSTPFSFGSASATPSSPVANKAFSNAYRFNFGGSKPDDTDKAKDQGTPATQAPSLFSSSPAKTPSIGSNFANTSGVKQAGAFSFGSSNINFGGSSSPSAFGTALGSTGFTFGSSPTKDSTKQSGDHAKDAS